MAYSILSDGNDFINYLLLFAVPVMVAETIILETNLIPKKHTVTSSYTYKTLQKYNYLEVRMLMDNVVLRGEA